MPLPMSADGTLHAPLHVESTAGADELLALGFRMQERGEHELALEIFREAARVAPGYPRALLNVGNALQSLGRVDEAEQAYRSVVAIDPTFAYARFNLGMLLSMSARTTAAKHELVEALRSKPDLVEAHVLLADLLEGEGNLHEAEVHLRSALDLRPRYAGAAYNLALVLLRANKFEDAEHWFLLARDYDPAAAAGGLSDFCWELNYRADLSPEAIFREHVRIGRTIARQTGPMCREFPQREGHDRLRIGYVSADFRLHPAGLLIDQVLALHDRSSFATYCYSNNEHADDVTRSIQRSAGEWRSISALDDDAAETLIRHDSIDVLVDLSGHSRGSRLAVFARKAAPIQVTWAGYLNTSGLDAMDYRLCDRHTDPAGETESLHTETLVRLPYSQWCYRPMAEMDIPAGRPSDAGDGIVFGSFNQYRKIGDACLDLWCPILARLTHARLMIVDFDGARLRETLLDRLSARGVEPERVSILGRLSVEEYFRALGRVDIALDSFPYNGATTTLDALWMGTPVVAFRGDRGIARGTYSILQSLGLDELCAGTEDEYREINARLALDVSWRKSLSARLRPMLKQSPLMDGRQFVADLEAAYRFMWERSRSHMVAERR
jgi:predicted O-linked N-acetylglucosamine transferase (SPINDLY family)